MIIIQESIAERALRKKKLGEKNEWLVYLANLYS